MNRRYDLRIAVNPTKSEPKRSHAKAPSRKEMLFNLAPLRLCESDFLGVKSFICLLALLLAAGNVRADVARKPSWLERPPADASQTQKDWLSSPNATQQKSAGDSLSKPVTRSDQSSGWSNSGKPSKKIIFLDETEVLGDTPRPLSRFDANHLAKTIRPFVIRKDVRPLLEHYTPQAGLKEKYAPFYDDRPLRQNW